MAPEIALVADMPASVDQGFNIVLKPLSHPELEDIHIDDDLFAVGRTEAPFSSYASDVAADLSRRHARIFSEFGAVYVADLDSKNGTTVNDVAVRRKPIRLQDGDKICFGRTLCYRVELGTRASRPKRAVRLVSLTLTPERGDLGLDPIVITRFPFLVGKSDEIFARYREAYPHQVNYLSRRHAHIFLKGSTPFVEDLGSTNGTFVSEQRLDEHAAPLAEGDLLAFGGHHFVYRVGLQQEEYEVEPTVTQVAAASPDAGEASGPAENTTFVAAPGSFLDIFCVDQGAPEGDNGGDAPHPPEESGKEKARGPLGGRLGIFLAALRAAFADSERPGTRPARRWIMALAVVVAATALVLYLGGGSERQVKDLLAAGDYARAATAADAYLASHPDDGEIRALGTEALLKAHVPAWLARLQARDFAGADAALAGMREAGRHNADVQPLLKELEWLGQVEKFVMGRGGIEAPVRIYADEDRIKALLGQWDESGPEHQRAFASISAQVPEFKDAYARILSYLRKLQSDDAVYLAAMERLKSAIDTELKRGHPEALEAVFKEYEEKYPRLGGLDRLRQDLRQFLEAEDQMGSPRLGPLVALATRARFSTPPFQARFQGLAGRLPPADIVGQYEAVAKAWRQGDSRQAFAALERMATAGAWADKAAKELAHKQAIAARYAELAGSRGAEDYDARLLAFYGSLDAAEDAYFLRAAEAELGLDKAKALARAQELVNQAQAQWRQYRENGAIDGKRRLEAGISSQFRSQARLLAEAQAGAEQGLRIYSQLKAEHPAQWRQIQDEINGEAEMQRRSLLDSRGVLEPGLLKAKLALLGGKSDAQGKSP